MKIMRFIVSLIVLSVLVSGCGAGLAGGLVGPGEDEPKKMKKERPFSNTEKSQKPDTSNTAGE